MNAVALLAHGSVAEDFGDDETFGCFAVPCRGEDCVAVLADDVPVGVVAADGSAAFSAAEMTAALG